MSTDSTSDTTRIGFSATLRIMCAADRHDEIEDITGLTATHQHEHGEPSFFGEPWPKDLWALESPLPPDAALRNYLKTPLELRAAVSACRYVPLYRRISANTAASRALRQTDSLALAFPLGSEIVP